MGSCGSSPFLPITHLPGDRVILASREPALEEVQVVADCSASGGCSISWATLLSVGLCDETQKDGEWQAWHRAGAAMTHKKKNLLPFKNSNIILSNIIKLDIAIKLYRWTCSQ